MVCTYFGTSFSRFQLENFVIPGVDMRPLYLDWLGLAKGYPMPALLPRRAPAPAEGVDKFLITSTNFSKRKNICTFTYYMLTFFKHTRGIFL